MLTKLLCSAMMWKAFIFRAFTCKLMTHYSPFFFLRWGGGVKELEVVLIITHMMQVHLFCFFAELCANVGLVGRRNKHLLSGNDILDRSQGIGRRV